MQYTGTDRFVRAVGGELSVNTLGYMVRSELPPPPMAKIKNTPPTKTLHEPRILDAPFLRASTQPFDVSGDLLGVQLGHSVTKRELYIYNIKTSSVLQTVPTSSDMTVVAWCDNVLYTAHKNGVVMWDANVLGTMIGWCIPNVQNITTLMEKPAALAWSRDASRANLEVYMLPSARSAFTLKLFDKPEALSTHNYQVVVGYADGMVVLHDLRKTGRPLSVLRLDHGVSGLSLGNTGVLAADSSGCVTLNGRPVLDVGAKICSLVSVPDKGTVIATGKALKKDGTANALATLTQKPWSSDLEVEKVYKFNKSHWLQHVCMSRNWLVAANPEQTSRNGTLFLWDHSTPRKVAPSLFTPLIR